MLDKPENPRSIRAKKAFREALIELLKKMPLSQITVSALSEKAGYSRFTFYNHFETKQDLVYSVIDERLERFFDKETGWNMFADDPQEQKQRFAKFFQIWGDDYYLIKLIEPDEFDQLLLERLLEYFTHYFYEEALPKTSLKFERLSSYVVTINAYVIVGTLREWLQHDMEIPPEEMGILLDHYLGPKIKIEMLQKLQGLF